MKTNHKLVYFGNEILKQKAEPVDTFNGELKEFVSEMKYIMDKADGIGLAAPQVAVAKQIITIDITSSKGPEITIINPEIIKTSNDSAPFDEGCLSIPGIYETVLRPSEILVKGYTVEGKEVEYEAKGLFARVLQHEMDHLKGILFIDRLEEYIRKEYTKELKKIKKMNKK